MNRLLIIFCCALSIQAQIVRRTQDIRGPIVATGYEQGGLGTVGATYGTRVATGGQRITGYRLVPVLGEGGAEEVTTTEIRRQGGVGGVGTVGVGGATFYSGAGLSTGSAGLNAGGAGLNAGFTGIRREVVSVRNDDSGYTRSEFDHSAPAEPYSFAYEAVNDDGTRSSRQETSDENHRVTGFYTLLGEDGQERRVEYVADENGFRAKVITNEVGTESKSPADAEFQSAAPTAAELSAKWTAEYGNRKTSYLGGAAGGAVVGGAVVGGQRVVLPAAQRFDRVGGVGVTRYDTVRSQQIGGAGGYLVAPGTAGRTETIRTVSRGSGLVSGGAANLGLVGQRRVIFQEQPEYFVQQQPGFQTIRTTQTGNLGGLGYGVNTRYGGAYTTGAFDNGGVVYGAAQPGTINGGEIIERRVITQRGGSGLGNGIGTFGLRTSAIQRGAVVGLPAAGYSTAGQTGNTVVSYSTNAEAGDVQQQSYGIPSENVASVEYAKKY